VKQSIFGTAAIGLMVTLSALVVFGGCANKPNVVKLAHDDIVFGQRFPAGTVFNLADDGESIKYCVLPRDYVIQGHTCMGKAGSVGWKTYFYPNGKLASIGLADTEVIDGIPCAVGNVWNEAFGNGGRTLFYENGRLKYTKVAETTEYQGHVIKKGQHVQLKEDGTIDSIK
jgi:hypothetical protein